MKQGTLINRIVMLLLLAAVPLLAHEVIALVKTITKR